MGKKCALINEPVGLGEPPRVLGALPLEPRWFRRRVAPSSPSRRALSPAGGPGRAQVLRALGGRGPSPAAQSAPASVRPNWGCLLHHPTPHPRQLSCGSGFAARGRFASPATGAWRGQGAAGCGSGGKEVLRPPLGRAPTPPSGGSPFSAKRGPREVPQAAPPPGHGRRRRLGTAPGPVPSTVPPHPLPAWRPPPPTASRGPSSAPLVV